MLSPEYLAGISDDIIELYSELDDYITRDIARRIVKTGSMTETAMWQIDKLQQSGALYDDVVSKVAQITDISDKQVQQLFYDAGVKSLAFDDSIYKAAGLSPIPLKSSPAALQVLNAGAKKTNGMLKNLTRTTANAAQQTYIHAATIAEMQITSGAFDPHTAIRNAVSAALQDGTHVIYPSGHQDRVDVAVRRAVQTGVGQTTGEISMMHAQDMGCDLMEISAHFGARPSHAEWQGQIVSLSSQRGYLTLDDIGYGTGDGFHGWNCAHDWYPYFDGISTRAYTQHQIDNYNNKKITYKDKDMTYYEATQQERAMERAIRDSKRNLSGYDEAIKAADKGTAQALQADFDNAAVKLKQQEAAYKDFQLQTGLYKTGSRVQVQGFNRSVSQKAKAARETSKEMKEYRDYEKMLREKYGDKLWRAMTNEEMSKYYDLERMAYKG